MTDNPMQKVTHGEENKPSRSSKMSYPWMSHVVHKTTVQDSNSSGDQNE